MTSNNQNDRMTAFDRSQADIEVLLRYFGDLTANQVHRGVADDHNRIDRDLRLLDIYWTLVDAAASLQGLKPCEIVAWLNYQASVKAAASVQS